MTIRNRLLAAGVAALLLVPIPALGQNVALATRAGTQGVGIGFVTNFVPSLNGRIDANYFMYGTRGVEVIDEVSVAWDVDGQIFFVSALADWHPLRNTLRLTGGLLFNGVGGTGGLVPDDAVDLGTRAYSPGEVGRIDANVSFKSKIAPYVGIGIGNPLYRRLSVLADVGIIYTGPPKVDLSGSGMIAPTAEEAHKIEDNISWIRFYPVVSLGFAVRVH